jgi:U3 small nucleolar RNA-associated protein 14
VNEYISAAAVRLDEAEALSRIEPFNRARRHFVFPLNKAAEPTSATHPLQSSPGIGESRR